jgi:hypothetical protein
VHAASTVRRRTRDVLKPALHPPEIHFVREAAASKAFTSPPEAPRGCEVEMGRWRQRAIGAALGAALGGLGALAHGAEMALTVSGLPSAPRSRHALAVGPFPAGIVFRAPADAALATAYVAWQPGSGRCTVAVHADADGAPGDELARAAVEPRTSWTAVALAAPLRAGAAYHLIVGCAGRSRARLAYAHDDARGPVADGWWRLERVRRAGVRTLPSPASPLFALVLADGTWWGSPYEPPPRAIRLCAGDEANAVIEPAGDVTVTGIRVRGTHATLAYRIDDDRGDTVLGGATGVAGSAATLSAGAAYVLRLANPTGGCARVAALATGLALGPPLAGFRTLAVRASDDGGRTWHIAASSTLAASLVTGAGGGPACGNGRRQGHEECDGRDDAACPGRCTTGCTCAPTSTTTTTASAPTTTTTVAATTTTLPPLGYETPYADGYLGFYDPNTIPLWPQRMILMLGEASAQGPLIANAKVVAASAGNGNAKFIFYQSLTDMDSRCSCSDQYFYDSFKDVHPEWILKDASGNPVTTSNGIGRLFATDIGNTAYVDAWADWAFAAMRRYGWDGTFADNIFRGNFASWSARPYDPRTGQPYTTADYRGDMLAALRRLRARYDASGKILVGNHSSAWDPTTFADPVVQQEILAMHGVEMEDCVFDFNGNRQSEASWIAQLRYLDYANVHGVRTICNGAAGSISDTTNRWYVLGSYLLTKEGFSSVGEINSVRTWWDGLATDLGEPLGRYYCLDPAADLARTATCPATGKIYVRDWTHGRVLVNPTASTTVTVPLGETLVDRGTSVGAVTLAAGSGVVLLRR